MKRVSAEERAAIEAEIIRLLGANKMTCGRIAEFLKINPKTVYGYLKHMEETRGILRRAGKVCKTSGWVYQWEVRPAEVSLPLWGARFVTDWPRGEHKRDPWDVALFGERRKEEAPPEVDPRQMDLLEGMG